MFFLEFRELSIFVCSWNCARDSADGLPTLSVNQPSIPTVPTTYRQTDAKMQQLMQKLLMETDLFLGWTKIPIILLLKITIWNTAAYCWGNSK